MTREQTLAEMSRIADVDVKRRETELLFMRQSALSLYRSGQETRKPSSAFSNAGDSASGGD